MNEVRKLYNNDGCVLKEYRNLCYNFEYEWGTNTPHCTKKGVCDEDCEYMKNFKG